MSKRNRNGGERVAAVEYITAAVSLPQNAPPCRYRDITTSTKTALARGFYRPNADWVDNPTANNLQIVAQTWIAVLFRSVLRTLVLCLQSGVSSATYNWICENALGTTFTLLAGSARSDLQLAYAKFSVGTAYHGTYLYPGVFGNRKFIWCDVGVLTITNLDALDANSDFVFTVWSYNAGDPIPQASVQYIASVAANTAKTFNTAYDYYCISWNSTTTTASPPAVRFTFQHVTTAGKQVFAHLSFPNLDNNQARVTGSRMIGNSLLISNVSADQYKAGSWAGLQLGKGDKWTTYIQGGTNNLGGTTFDPYAKVTAVKGVVVGDLKNGMYAYHKPTDQDEFDLKTPFSLGLNQALTGCNGFDLENDTATLMVITAPTGAGTLSHAFRLSWDCSLEFTTEDMWTMVESSPFDPDEWEKAMMVLASMQQFYDNPVHWKRILSTIGTLAHVGGTIVSLFGPYGRAIGGVLSAIGTGARFGAAFAPD